MSDKKPTLQELHAEAATAMRKKGMTWSAIAERLGVSLDTAVRAGDPEYARRRQEKNNANRSKWRERFREKGATAAAMIVPPPVKDTRDLTGRMFGDPLPGRSALDQRGGMA